MEEATGPWRWRPEPRWLVMPLLGSAAGGVFGILVVGLWTLADALGGESSAGPLSGVVVVFVLGGYYGALCGFICGVPIGVVLMFLPGRNSRRVAWLAFAGAAATNAVALGALLGLAGSVPGVVGVLVLVGSSLVAGLVASWFQGRLPNRPRLAAADAD